MRGPNDILDRGHFRLIGACSSSGASEEESAGLAADLRLVGGCSSEESLGVADLSFVSPPGEFSGVVEWRSVYMSLSEETDTWSEIVTYPRVDIRD